MKLKQIISLFIILNQLNLNSCQDLFPTTESGLGDPVYKFSALGVTIPDTNIRYGYLGIKGSYTGVRQIQELEIVDTLNIKLKLVPKNLTSRVKIIKVDNFTNRWNILLLAFHLSEIVKRQRNERKISGAMLQVTESSFSLVNSFFLPYDVFCTLNEIGTVNETETVNKVNLSYSLRVGLGGIKFKKTPGNLENVNLPKFFRRKFTFEQITYIKVDEAAEHKIQIGFKVSGEVQIYVFPSGDLCEDKLYLINFFRTILLYYKTMSYVFVPRADTDNPSAKVAQFAGARLTPAEIAAGKRRR
jgi:hypothetical protein